jgi:galactoside O-acetyltransferase/dTDP-4-amino-4,6-dideoxygalactose transaminase
VEVAEGCAVGAMSLVVRSTEPWFIYAGIPARKRGPRRQDLLQLEQAYLRESVLHSEAD